MKTITLQAPLSDGEKKTSTVSWRDGGYGDFKLFVRRAGRDESPSEALDAMEGLISDFTTLTPDQISKLSPEDYVTLYAEGERFLARFDKLGQKKSKE